MRISATELLKKQHRKVERALGQLERGTGDAEALLAQIADDLAAHMAIEHEILYPAAAEVDAELVSEAFEEHALAEIALKRLLACEPGVEIFQARVSVLKELIKHHVEEEEETLFPKLQRKIGQRRLDELGLEMKQRFDELVEVGPMQVVPKTQTKTSADRDRRKVDAIA
jgi:iron-sulfur cluster repair protein YtfE (RIC family)